MRDISDEVRNFHGSVEKSREAQKIYNGWERGDLTPEKAHAAYHTKPYDIGNENCKFKVKRRINNVQE